MPYEDKGRLSSTASPYKLVDHLPRRTALQSRPVEARGSASPLAVQPSFFAGLSNVAVVLPAMARDLALDFSQAGLPAGAWLDAWIAGGSVVAISDQGFGLPLLGHVLAGFGMTRDLYARRDASRRLRARR